MEKTKKVVKIVLSVFQWIVIAILGIICFFSISMIVSKVTSNERIPKTFGYSMLRVITGSMVPTINPNDVVVIKELEDDEYQVGMIVAFYDNPTDSLPTLHRVIERNGNTIITQGDAEVNTGKEEMDVSEVLGAEVLTIRKFGKFVEYVQKPVGTLTIIVAGFLIIELPSFVKGIVGYIKESKKSKEEPKKE